MLSRPADKNATYAWTLKIFQICPRPQHYCGDTQLILNLVKLYKIIFTL
jgi:hypothetical protein